jgi:hypothetical protein
MTATDARIRLHRLEAERLDALEAGLGDNALYMRDLAPSSAERVTSAQIGHHLRR